MKWMHSRLISATLNFLMFSLSNRMSQKRHEKTMHRHLQKFYLVGFQALMLTLCSRANAVPWLHVNGNHLEDPSGHHVVLRGVDTAAIDVMAQYQLGIKPMLDKMINGGDSGFDSKVVRLMIDPGSWQQNPDHYFNSFLKPSIDYCIQKNVYCIIDWHSISDYNNANIDSQIRSFWSYVAPKFKDVPNVIYELYNEPVNPQDWQTWKQWAQPWVDLIRAVAPQNIIIVGSPGYSHFTQFIPASPFRGSNLVYTMHTYPGNSTDWETFFGAASNSIPVFLTEFGWLNSDPSQCHEFCGTTSGFGVPLRNFLDNVHPNINWSAWDMGYGPSMIDQNYNIWGGEDHHGQFIQQWLKDKKNSDQPTDSGSANTNNSPQTLYINAGGSAFTASNGNNWVADEYFDGGNTVDRGNITVQRNVSVQRVKSKS